MAVALFIFCEDPRPLRGVAIFDLELQLLIVAVDEITAEAIAASFGELPPETFHGAHLAADAAQALAAKLRVMPKH